MKRQNGFEICFEIERRLRNKIPTSLIRLGDGEGAVMGYPDVTNIHDLNRSLRNWFGQTDYDVSHISSFTEQLRNAVRQADIVGIPRAKQVASHHLYRAVMESISKFNLLSASCIYTDAAIHRLLQFSLLYRRILQNRDFLGIITPRDIGSKLKDFFNIQHVESYPVKGQFKWPGEVTERHFPEGYERLKETLRVPYQGALFFVGAGALGKVYCTWIKQQGGVAIDIGAIFDAWSGVKSRLVHPCHSFDVYSDFPTITAEKAMQRYNLLCENFELDTPRITADNATLMVPAQW